MPNKRVLSWSEAEMLRTLWHLRYLSTNQIYSRWYRERSHSACVKRLSRLGQGGVLKRAEIGYDGEYRSAWRLGRAGLVHIRELFDQAFPSYGDMASMSLPRLLKTNQVFLHLVEPEPVWPDLPFTWSGSGSARFACEREGRKRELRIDALIEPAGAPYRVLVELDRGRVPIRAHNGESSVQRKLEEYHWFTHGLSGQPIVVQRGYWYSRAFKERRRPVLLWVLTHRDPDGKRARAIHGAARGVSGDGGTRWDVRTVHVDDPRGLRGLILHGRSIGTSRPVEPVFNTARIDTQAIGTFASLHELAGEAHKRLNRKSRVREPLRKALWHAGRVIEALRKEASG